jgi:peptidoglycan/xylan/chitin deacetylase (PgdA/CDA1 family)
MKHVIAAIMLMLLAPLCGQTPDDRIDRIVAEYAHVSRGVFGMNVPGVRTHFQADDKVIALTFDACGGRHGDGFDRELIDFLTLEDIPATMFLTARWILARPMEASELTENPLFEIENHGTLHKPLGLHPCKIYGIGGTGSAREAADEVLGGAEIIAALTGRMPTLYRSGTAYYDQSAVKLANELGFDAVNGNLIPVDGDSTHSAEYIADLIVTRVKPGTIVMLHMNHPERNTCEALRKAVPILRSEGWRFTRLDGRILK